MLRKIETHGDKDIWKSSDGRTGVSNFYGIRAVGAIDTPFDEKFDALWKARQALGVEIKVAA